MSDVIRHGYLYHFCVAYIHPSTQSSFIALPYQIKFCIQMSLNFEWLVYHVIHLVT